MAVAERRARAIWEGTLAEGNGSLTLESSDVLVEAPVTWAARTEESAGRTSPEELLAAAHAVCYAMSLSGNLARRETPPERLEVSATATFEKGDTGFRVGSMTISVRGRVPGIEAADFQEAAGAAEAGCPISNAIRGNVEIRLEAELD